MANKILLDKNGVKFTKLTPDTFHIAFAVENSLDVRPLINLNLLKLLHDLNPDLFESYADVNRHEAERHIYILFKDLFAELGIPQYYSNFSVALSSCSSSSSSSSTITFTITPLHNVDTDSTTLVAVPLTHCELVCTLINNTLGQFNITARINNADLFNSFFEKMVAMILYKVVNRLKQFISTIT
jgi:hypothetical protein